jgi:hypothetical protein
LAAAIPVSAGLLLWPLLAERRANTGISRSFVTDMQPVEIELRGLGGGTRLSIPAAYMQWSFDRSGESKWQVALTAVYPEMTPFALLNEEERSKLRTTNFSGRDLRFAQLVHVYGSRPGVQEELLSHEIGRKNTVNLGERNGFQLYREKIADLYYDYLVPTGMPDKRFRYFKCAAMLEAQLPDADTWRNCSGQLQLGGRLSLDYIIPRSELGQWNLVEKQVETLVHSFVVDCFDSQGLKSGERPVQTYACTD